MGSKGKKRPPVEEDTSPRSAKKGRKGKETQPQEEEDTGPEPAGPSSGRQARPSHEDYNIPTPERTELLTNLKNLLKVDLVSPTFWACCQLSDIETLKFLVDIAKTKPYMVLGYVNHISVVPRLWTQRLKGSSVSGKPPNKSNKSKKNSDGEKWVQRCDEAVGLCRQRDRVCVLTGAMGPQAAHIFPYCMLNKTANKSDVRYTAQADFWMLLKVFWDDDRVDKWRNKIFPDPRHPDTGVDSCFNLISLTPTAHAYWNDGRFALKPLSLSNDEKKLTIQFFWQPQYDHKLQDRVDLLKEPLSSESLNVAEIDGKPCFLSRLVRKRASQIKSGDIFTLTTDDPGKRPLPSWELLEMQWILQRITAMSGAAGTPELEFNDDDDIDSQPALIPDDNNGNIRSYLDDMYRWIPYPPLSGSVPSIANQENPNVLARDMPRQVVNVS